MSYSVKFEDLQNLFNGGNFTHLNVGDVVRATLDACDACTVYDNEFFPSQENPQFLTIMKLLQEFNIFDSTTINQNGRTAIQIFLSALYEVLQERPTDTDHFSSLAILGYLSQQEIIDPLVDVGFYLPIIQFEKAKAHFVETQNGRPKFLEDIMALASLEIIVLNRQAPIEELSPILDYLKYDESKSTESIVPKNTKFVFLQRAYDPYYTKALDLITKAHEPKGPSPNGGGRHGNNFYQHYSI